MKRKYISHRTLYICKLNDIDDDDDDDDDEQPVSNT